MIDDPDHMEAVGHNGGLWEVLLHQRSIPCDSSAAAEHDVVDLVVLQIAEGCRITLLPAEEVLVDAEHLRKLGAGFLQRQAAQVRCKPALDGGTGNPFSSRQTTAADAVEVLLANAPVKSLAGPLPWQDAGETLPEIAAAAQTSPLHRLQMKGCMPCSPALVA